MGPTIQVNQSSEVAGKVIEAVLGQHGYHVVRSFDLKDALSSDSPACTAPGQGACQYTVLLVYPPVLLSQPMQVVTIQGVGYTSVITLLFEPAARGEARDALFAVLQEAAQAVATFQPVPEREAQLVAA